MVGAVSAAGKGGASMMIKGGIDTSNMDKGFKRVRTGLNNVKGSAKSFTSDLHRMSVTTGRLVKKLGLLTIAGVGAMVGIASKAPAVAPALAKMGVAMGKLQRNLGEALAPSFERVVGWLEKLSVWVGANQASISEIATKFLDWAEAVGKKLWPVLEKVGKWAMEHPNLFGGIVAGLVLAPAVLTGISAISGFVTTMASAVMSPTLMTALGLLAIIGGGIATGAGLAEQFQVGQGASVPLPAAAQQQISGATGTGRYDLINRYSDRISGAGYGPEQTAQINVGTGELYSNKQRDIDIVNYMSQSMNSSISFSNKENDRRIYILQYENGVWG